MTTHTEKSSLDARLDFLGLDEKARQQLRALAPSIGKNIGAALDVFYKKVRATPETAAFFRSEDHLQGAKKRQEGHWGIVTTAQFDERYVEGVTAVGKAHARIGLEPRWYIGGYALLVEQLIHAVVRERWPSRFARKEGKVLGEEIGVLVKSALLDMDYAITVYLDILAAQRKAAEDARAKAEEEQVVALRALSEVLSRLSGGDLEAKLSPEQPENFVGMAQDYNASVEKLRDTIGTVRSAAEEILRSTSAISGASNHLAQRTEQQAAGLEESTAALHELTQNVTLAADGAQKAASVVSIALDEARASGEVVTRADRKSTRLNSSHNSESRMPSSA
jgi:methyl-accepting chemotaxis protein